MSEKQEPGGRKPSRRSLRYGKLVRGWDWRTSPELLEKANEARERLNLTKTELIERAIEKYIEEQ
jgi:predicted DNA-binding protein